MHTVRTTEYKGYKIKWSIDDMPMDPQNDWDQIVALYLFHRRYDLGHNDNPYNTKNFEGWEEISDQIREDHDILAMRSVYMLDHSGLSFRLGGDFRDVDPGGWDSGMVGFAFIDRWTFEQLTGKDADDYDTSYFMKILEGQAKEYFAFAEGDVYCYIVERPDGSHMDSCCGYYGYEAVKEHEETLKEWIDEDIKEIRQRQFNRLKQKIKSKVPIIYREPYHEPTKQINYEPTTNKRINIQ